MAESNPDMASLLNEDIFLPLDLELLGNIELPTELDLAAELFSLGNTSLAGESSLASIIESPSDSHLPGDLYLPDLSYGQDFSFLIPGDWNSIAGDQQPTGFTADDNSSVCPTDLNGYSVPPSEVGEDELEAYENDVVENGVEESDEEELEQDDEPVRPRSIIPLPRRAAEVRDNALQLVWGLRPRRGHPAVETADEVPAHSNVPLKSRHASFSGEADPTSASHSASTSASAARLASGINLQDNSHGPRKVGDRDIAIKNNPTAKGKGKANQTRAPKARGSQVSAPLAKSSGTRRSKAQVKIEPVKGPNGYADPTGILHRLREGIRVGDIDAAFFPADQAVRIENNRYTCQVKGDLTATGRAVWQGTNSAACGVSFTSDESYKRHIIASHLGVHRGSGELKERIGKFVVLLTICR
ncbi:hypothetical protein PIIN_10174 [Serendipita indica DSM 11827]|uniref:C2H2-type domain-containing protein n=1 Tax=Serendipita indica (strain DSM 11827) TaxID=1109443 RepID=G4TXY8_SERID|nr:hypothetical protein PIIN_10174 [Serendipita indica DSM 11827]